MLTLLIVICSVFFLVTTGPVDSFRPKTVRFNIFNGMCPEYPNVPMYFTDVRVTNLNRTYYVNMKLHVLRDVNSKDLKLHLYLTRCSSRDALDSCETYKTIKLNHFCTLLKGDNKPWSPFRNHFHPPTTGCPLKKGEHEAKNGTFDGSAFSHFPISDFYWKIKIHLLTDPGDNIIMCNEVEGQIAPI